MGVPWREVAYAEQFGAGGSSACWQEPSRVDRFPVLPNLEVQHHTFGLGASHLGNTVTDGNARALTDEDRIVVRIST